MRRHLAYARYVFRHKWFVFVECCRLGIPWLGLIHDWSKFLPSEWFPYARFFHEADGTLRQRRDKTGYYRPTNTGDQAFDRAIFLHLGRRNKHHWQAWAMVDSVAVVTVFPVPDRYRREMLADWRGAARAQGLPRESVSLWWDHNGLKMKLHHETRAWVDARLRGNTRAA